MENVTKEFIEFLNKHGYKNNNQFKVKPFLLVIVSMFSLFENIFSLITKWENINRRFAALEDTIICGTTAFLRLYMFLYTIDIYKCITSYNKPYFMYGLESVNKVQAIINFNKKIRWQADVLYYVLHVMHVNFILLPCVQTIYKILMKSEPVTTDNIVLPFEVSLFISSNYFVVSVILLFQVFVARLVVDSGKTVFITFLSAVYRVTLDIELLGISFRDIDTFLEKFQIDDMKEHNCQLYVKNLARHHVDICIQIKLYNEHLRFFACNVVIGVCAYLCLLFYWFIEVDDNFILKVKDGSQIILLLGYLYGYSSLGQQVINQFDSLSSVMYECNWYDKSTTVKRSLLIMMSMANRQFELKPYGVYTVGLANVTSVLKATYSYFSVLRQTSNNKIING